MTDIKSELARKHSIVCNGHCCELHQMNLEDFMNAAINAAEQSKD